VRRLRQLRKAGCRFDVQRTYIPPPRDPPWQSWPRGERGKWRWIIKERLPFGWLAITVKRVPRTYQSLVVRASERDDWAYFASRKDAEQVAQALVILES